MKHLVVCGSQGYRVGRGIDSPAYDSASRRRDGLAQDSFSFSENGKELCFVGLPRGAVEAVNSAAVDALPAWELPDNWSTLPNGDKSAAVYIAGPGLGFLACRPSQERRWNCVCTGLLPSLRSKKPTKRPVEACWSGGHRHGEGEAARVSERMGPAPEGWGVGRVHHYLDGDGEAHFIKELAFASSSWIVCQRMQGEIQSAQKSCTLCVVCSVVRPRPVCNPALPPIHTTLPLPRMRVPRALVKDIA